MKKNIEQQLSHAGNKVWSKVATTQPKNILINFDEQQQRSRSYYLIKYATVSFAILLFFVLCGFVVKNLYFSNLTYFSALEDEEYVNVYNLTKNQNDYSVTLQAVLSDGINTYARIKINNPLTSVQSTPNNYFEDFSKIIGVIDNNKEEIYNKINFAKLTDVESGEELYLVSDNIPILEDLSKLSTSYSSSSVGNLNPDFRFDENLNDDEAILVFNGTFSDNSIINFAIAFGQDPTITFSNIKMIVPEVIVKDVSNQNYTIEFPGATGRVTSVTYALFKTVIDVDWESTDEYSEYIACQPARTYYHKISAAGYNEYASFGPPSSEKKKITVQYSFMHKLDSNEPIQFIQYKYVDGKMTDTDIDKVLCTIN